MEYFKHTFQDVEYEFRPNRVSKMKIDKMQREERKQNPEMLKSALKLAPKIEKEVAELEELKKKLETVKEEDQAELQEQIEDKLAELEEILPETYMVVDSLPDLESQQKKMYIILTSQKKEDFTPRYPNLTETVFEQLCDDIAKTYGLDEYEEICGAIVEDVFTMSGEAQKAEPKSQYLKNRKANKK